MFDLSLNCKKESEESGSDKADTANFMESLEQNIINSPAIMAVMSNEMRNQMNAIVSFAYLLNKKEYNEEEREEFSNQIFDSCEQMISLFDNFVDSAIIDAGSPVPEPKICSPDKTFNELFLEFREILVRIKYKDILFVTENQSFNNTEYLIDTNRITRVIRNLFQNALANTKSGYIKAGYYFRNEKLTFYVLDSGQGYYKCREFLQTRNLTQSLSKFNDMYSAVNLALTRKLIEIMDGSVWIECNGLTGSGIYFSIPVSTVNSEDITNKYLNNLIAI